MQGKMKSEMRQEEAPLGSDLPGSLVMNERKKIRKMTAIKTHEGKIYE